MMISEQTGIKAASARTWDGRRIARRGAVCWAVLVLGGMAPAPLLLAVAAGDDTNFAGSLRRVVLGAFTAATHERVRVVSVAAASPPHRPPAAWDVALLDPLTLAQDCALDLVVRMGEGCGVAAYRRSTVLSWDPARVPGMANWSDLWNVVRIPGKRGLRRSPIGTLEIALLADGVAPQDVYAALRSAAGVDRAFGKLDQLRRISPGGRRGTRRSQCWRPGG